MAGGTCQLIITKGLGCSTSGCNRLVTQGYGGPPKFVEEAVRRFIKGHGGGRRRREDELEEICVWAKLIEYNNRQPEEDIEGCIRVPVKKHRYRVAVERVTQRVRKAWEDIRVTVKRIK